jgi:hypothetical protein
MTFDITRWTRQTLAFNSGALVLDGPLTENGPALFSYQSAADALATIAAANYFSSQVRDLAVGDIIFVNGSDASNMYIVATVDRDAETITVSSFTASGVVATANIQDGAVTTAKLADGAVTNAKLEEGLINHVQVDVALADFIGSYTASELLVAAPGAGKKIILHRATLAINYGGTVLASGGASHIQYANTANGAGPKATGTIAAATLIAATADTTFGFTPVDTTLVDSTTLNQGLYFAMATADFTGGTSSTYKFDLWYSIVDLA